MRAARAVALFETLLCSDFPTQFVLGATLGAFGVLPKTANGDLSVRYVAILSLADTALLIGLILLLLRSHRERPRDVFLGSRSVTVELKIGLPMTLVAFVIAIT